MTRAAQTRPPIVERHATGGAIGGPLPFRLRQTFRDREGNKR